ncbi:hypothetical protein BC830DRAFT_1220146, partial [Chytriomyces sp. MP71]
MSLFCHRECLFGEEGEKQLHKQSCPVLHQRSHPRMTETGSASENNGGVAPNAGGSTGSVRVCASCGQTCGLVLRGPHINAVGKKFYLEHFGCHVFKGLSPARFTHYEPDDKVPTLPRDPVAMHRRMKRIIIIKLEVLRAQLAAIDFHGHGTEDEALSRIHSFSCGSFIPDINFQWEFADHLSEDTMALKDWTMPCLQRNGTFFWNKAFLPLLTTKSQILPIKTKNGITAVYCLFHYSVLFAAKCGGCQTAVLKKFVEMRKEGVLYQWHPQCYMIYKSCNSDNQLWNVKANFQHEHVTTLSKQDPEVCLDQFIEYVDALFKGINAIDSQLAESGGPAEGIVANRKEPRQLATRISAFALGWDEHTKAGVASCKDDQFGLIYGKYIKELDSTGVEWGVKDGEVVNPLKCKRQERTFDSDTCILDFLSLLMTLEKRNSKEHSLTD